MLEPMTITPVTTTAAILVGGLGTRLAKIVADRPKPLALVAGRPFLAILLDQLHEAGFQSVVLMTGFRADMIREEFGLSWRGMTLAYSVEDTPLGTGGALRHALDHLHVPTVLVMNGDSFCEADLGEFQRAHAERARPASLALAQVPDTARYGAVELDAHGRITAFREKGGPSGPGLINAGVYLVEREAIASIPGDGPISLEQQMFPRWMERGMSGWMGCRRFIDIGIPEDYHLAQTLLADRAR
jgi:D-glycero-alpha-D-manno-heptose 1-phosphate guanylyltransferase